MIRRQPEPPAVFRRVSAITIVGLALAAGCTGGDTAQTPSASAAGSRLTDAAALVHAGGPLDVRHSVRITGLEGLEIGEVQAPDVEDGVLEVVQTEGRVEPSRDASELRMDMPRAGIVDLVRIGPEVFIRAPALARVLEEQSYWFEADMTDTSATEFAAASAGHGDPSRLIDLVGGAVQVTETGSDTIDGKPVARYSGVIDPDAAVAATQGLHRSVLQATIEGLREVETEGWRFDAWVDEEGMLRRLIVWMEMDPLDIGAPAGAIGTTPVLLESRIDLTPARDTGQVRRPPSGQIRPLPDLIPDEVEAQAEAQT